MAVEGDSYCTAAEVEERLLLQNAFSASTTPTLDQVLSMMAMRSATVTTVFRDNGIAWTTSSGSSPIPATGDGVDISRMSAMVVALYVAGDVLAARDVTSEKTEQYWTEAAAMLELLRERVMVVAASVVATSYAMNHKHDTLDDPDYETEFQW